MIIWIHGLSLCLFKTLDVFTQISIPQTPQTQCVERHIITLSQHTDLACHGEMASPIILLSKPDIWTEVPPI